MGFKNILIIQDLWSEGDVTNKQIYMFELGINSKIIN